MRFSKTKIISLFMSICLVFGLLTFDTNSATEEINIGGQEVLIAGMTPDEFYASLESNEDVTMPLDIGNSGMQLELIPGIQAPPMTIGGRVAYCLNLWKDFPVGNNYPTSSPYDDVKIRATLYHGYPVDASGLQAKYSVSDAHARYYTQVAIWQAMGDLTSKNYGIPYIDELLAKMRAGDVGIRSFSISENTLKFSNLPDGRYESQRITTSGASGTFTVSPADSRIKVVNADNGSPITTAAIGTPIKVQVASDFDGEVNVSISTSLKKPASLKWTGAGGNYQDMCEFQWGDPLPGADRMVGNIESKGSITISKTDAVTGKELAGAKFEVRRHSDNALIKELTTGPDGRASVGDLNFDEYVIRETSAPENYWVDSTPHRVVINAGNKNYTHTAGNRPKRAQIKITKIDKDTQAPLAGGVFEIKNTKTQVVNKVTTTEDGTVLSDWLVPGIYEVREVQPPTGYILGEETLKTIEITGNPELIEVTFSNQRIRGKLKVIKTDGENDFPLKGAVFGVFKKGTEEKVAELTTDENGMSTTDWLDYGSYDVKELKAPDGYYISDQVWDLNITEHEKTYVIQIGNKPAKAIIQVKKTDAETGEPLEGVGFKIQDSKGEDIIFKVLNEEGEYDEIDTFFTNAEGVAVTPGFLYKGNYKLVEVQHSPIYIGIDPIDFTISESEVYPEIELNPTKVIEVKNEKVKGEVILNKTFSPTLTDNKVNPYTTPRTLFEMRKNEITGDGSTESPIEPDAPEEPIGPDDEKPAINVDEDLSHKAEPYALAQARFTVYKLNSEILYPNMTDEEKAEAEWQDLGTFETDELGKIGLANLTYGSYAIVEVDTPHDFIPIKDIYFEILEDGQIVNLDVINQAATGKVEITKVDIHDGELLPGAKFEILDENKNVILEGVTDENGLFSFTLGLGKYYYKETEAPNLNGTEYILDENEYPFEIKENGEIVKCKAPNKKRQIPKTAAELGGAGTAMALTTLLGTFYLLKKRK